MKKISLKMKLFALVSIPLFLALVLSVFVCDEYYENYKAAQLTLENSSFILLLSKSIDQLQLERGKTASFLTGGLELSVVEDQRRAVDLAVTALKNHPSSAAFATIASSLQALTENRSDVSAKKVSSEESTGRYRNIIVNFIQIEKEIAAMTKAPDLRTALYSLVSIEEAKDNAGRMRANITAALSSNAAVSEERFNLIVGAKGGVTTNLQSSSLYVTDSTKRDIQGILAMNEWKFVENILNQVLKGPEKGTIETNPKDFFAKSSVVVDAINSIVGQQVTFIQMLASKNGAESKKMLSIVLSTFLLITGLISFLSFFFVRNLAYTLHDITVYLEKGSKGVTLAAESAFTSSVNLSQGTTEQSAAIQETSSAMSEINAMIGKNAESTESSKSLAHLSVGVIEKGQANVSEMIRSVANVEASSDRISTQVEESNKRTSEIIDLMFEIEDKTKVINEIVFQTKLLSFNASVEAARAGDQGKGFSIVADEISNLAKLSGESARQIAELIDRSKSRVQSIIKDSSQSLTELLAENTSQLKAGVESAEKCGHLFQEIKISVEQLTLLISDIANASREQSVGIEQVTKAMKQLDEVTNENSQIAQVSSNSAGQLSEEAKELNRIVERLKSMIQGGAESEQNDTSALSLKNTSRKKLGAPNKPHFQDKQAS